MLFRSANISLITGAGSFVDLELQIRSDGAVLVVTNEGSPFERRAVDMTTMGFGEERPWSRALGRYGFRDLGRVRTREMHGHQ